MIKKGREGGSPAERERPWEGKKGEGCRGGGDGRRGPAAARRPFLAPGLGRRHVVLSPGSASRPAPSLCPRNGASASLCTKHVRRFCAPRLGSTLVLFPNWPCFGKAHAVKSKPSSAEMPPRERSHSSGSSLNATTWSPVVLPRALSSSMSRFCPLSHEGGDSTQSAGLRRHCLYHYFYNLK